MMVSCGGTGTQLNGRSTTYSFDEQVFSEEGEEFTVNDVLSIDAEDPSVQAARRMDWDEFLTSLSRKEKAVIECLLAGKNCTKTAKTIRVSTWTVKNYKVKLAQKITEFMGADILTVIAQRPGWIDGLNCERERLACRTDRRQ